MKGVIVEQAVFNFKDKAKHQDTDWAGYRCRKNHTFDEPKQLNDYQAVCPVCSDKEIVAL